jgi:hypothetical protein
MALPLPQVVPDVGPGGRLVTNLNAINALQNAQILKSINAIKEQYAPQLTQADINSKNAYSRLVGLQPLGKILGNENAYNVLPDEQKNEINARFLRAGGVGPLPFPENNPTNNALNGMTHSQEHAGIGQPSTNSLSRFLVDKFKNSFPNNPSISEKNSINALVNPSLASKPQELMVDTGNSLPKDNINHDLDAKFLEYMNTSQGQKALADEEKMLANQDYAERPLTNAEKVGRAKGTIKQGETEGKFRAEALKDIGKSQLALSNAGAALNNLTKVIENPVFKGMRDKIPAFQDKQLSALKVIGTDAEKKLIGQYIAAAESVVANTVAGMGTRHLVREYDLATRQKINDKDTIQSAEGKLQNAVELHDIAEQKNDIIADLLKQGVDEAMAVKQANKMVDVSAIEKRTNALFEDKITEDDINTTAKEMGMTREQVIERLRSEGRYHG